MWGEIVGVNFTDVLRKAFTRQDPKNAQNRFKWSVFYAPLGSAHAKIACKMLVKLALDVITFPILMLITNCCSLK